MRKYKSRRPMGSNTKVIVTGQMAKQKRILQVLATLATGVILPSLSVSQQQSSIGPVRGPYTAISTPLAALPSSPDATLNNGSAKAMGNAAMFPIQPVQAPSARDVRTAHPFWDRENLSLFAVSAGWSAADFYVTRSNLDNGGRELNPIARAFSGSTPALAANFALETTGVVGISYFFHKTGHHKLERATSYVNISASAGAVLYGLTHH